MGTNGLKNENVMIAVPPISPSLSCNEVINIGAKLKNVSYSSQIAKYSHVFFALLQ